MVWVAWKGLTVRYNGGDREFVWWKYVLLFVGNRRFSSSKDRFFVRGIGLFSIERLV